MLSSQTIGVEFSSKIIKVGTGSGRKRIKLQLWDTAGTERFRSVSRSYYRGAAGAIIVYDVASHPSFEALPTFLNDARALASPNLTVLLAGNKSDLVHELPATGNAMLPQSTFSNLSSSQASPPSSQPGFQRSSTSKSSQTVTVAPEGREITPEEAAQWASRSQIPVSVEVSAFTGDGVEEVFTRLASIILTKIELGEINPDDPMSGIQYGDSSGWNDGDSVKSSTPGAGEEIPGQSKSWRRPNSGKKSMGQGIREWQAVFKMSKRNRRRDRGCC